MSSTWSSGPRYLRETITGNSRCLVKEYTVVTYWSPSRLIDCAFLANTTGTLPKCLAATHAMPMPDASIVRILVIVRPAKCPAQAAPIASYSATSHWWLRKASTLSTLPSLTVPSRRMRSSSSCMMLLRAGPLYCDPYGCRPATSWAPTGR